MKLLYRGGLNKYDPEGWQKSYFYEYEDTYKRLISEGKKIAFVTFAKPDHFYDEYIIPQFGDAVDIIDNTSDDVNWSSYDLILLCGGDTVLLKKGLEAKNFDIAKLKPDAVVLGDSAGAMIMSPYFYDTEDRVTLDFHHGIYDENHTIVIVHTNNERYCNDELIEKVSSFANEHGLQVLKLQENETMLFDESSGEFVEFEFDTLF